MAYYCGECVVWVGSSDVDRYGRRWCSYSRRYEESNQNTYGCKGFVYNGRTVVTKVCEILHLSKEPWFEAFDAVKEAYVVPHHMDWLTSYCKIGPMLAKEIENDENPIQIAQKILNDYMKPARSLWQQGKSKQAAERYKKMIADLSFCYHIA
ncbi:MAG: hypothetical protein IJQ33_00665 [Clostridia bacterium]|nr:hypothetical protein [Clostridia bacterium]MBR0217704.1 hypothetical protein [Clostridia bacterium]